MQSTHYLHKIVWGRLFRLWEILNLYTNFIKEVKNCSDVVGANNKTEDIDHEIKKKLNGKSPFYLRLAPELGLEKLLWVELVFVCNNGNILNSAENSCLMETQWLYKSA